MSAPETTHHRRLATGGSDASDSDDSDDNQSCHWMPDSGNVRRKSCESDCSVEGVDLESGVLEVKKVVHLSKVERNCRICHLLAGGGGTDPATGVPIDLGCSCKGDLGAAHKQCAETWFKIKGDTWNLQICGVTAFNISSDHKNEANSSTATAASVPEAPMIQVETRTMWHGLRIMNFLLACMILAFVISWLFHFKVLS